MVDNYLWQVPLVINDREYPQDEQYDNCPLHYVVRPRRRKTYSPQHLIYIQMIYIIAVIIWALIIFIFGFYETDILGWLILIIPIGIFAVNYINLSLITKEVEDQMLKGNFLSFAFLITVVLINWSKIDDKAKYFKILFIALIFMMLSLMDIWVKPENLCIVKHIKSILYTFSLTLLVYGLYIYYVELIRDPPPDKSNKSIGDKDH